HQRRELLIEAAGLDEIGNDDRIGSRARGAQGAVARHQIGIDRIQPKLGAAGDEGLQRTRHDETSMMDPHAVSSYNEHANLFSGAFRAATVRERRRPLRSLTVAALTCTKFVIRNT